MLRRGSTRWGPRQKVKGRARVKRGVYKCEGCGNLGPATLPPEEGKKRRRNNAVVDHIKPVVDPAVGFESWDVFISNLFCEEEYLQLLCWTCHHTKTQEERAIANERRRTDKDSAS